jgi:uncharacterized protein (DUF1330 family)
VLAALLAVLVLLPVPLRGSASAGVDPDPSAAQLDRLVAAYHEPGVDPSRRAWRRLLADAESTTSSVDVLEFVKLERTRGAKSRYDRYVAALKAALTSHGATMITVNDTLQVGVGSLPGYAGGVSWLARFPSRRAYIDTLLDRRVLGSSRDRRTAVAQAQLLLGSNVVPGFLLDLPPNTPASAFPSGRVEGKTPGQIVEELLAIYPDGGADPTRAVLDRMIRSRGFADEPLTYVNLYEFGPETGGAAALNEYNAGALPLVLAHGGRPKSLVNVSQHLVGPTAWSRFIVISWPSFAVFTDLRLDPGYIEAQRSRVVSAKTYGNLITLAR